MTAFCTSGLSCTGSHSKGTSNLYSWHSLIRRIFCGISMLLCSCNVPLMVFFCTVVRTNGFIKDQLTSTVRIRALTDLFPEGTSKVIQTICPSVRISPIQVLNSERRNSHPHWQ